MLAEVLPAVLLGLVLLLAACGSAGPSSSSRLVAVGAESQYANVIAQVGGRYVQASAILSNPNTDPHTFQASAGVAERLSQARLVVQNGLGYDGFMEKLESASPSRERSVIDVQRLLHLPSSTPNPHLWYDPRTMPKVAAAVAGALGRAEPDHASYFRANAAAFDRSLDPWNRAIASLRSSFPGAPVAVTEPVADDLIQAAGLHNQTPWTFQADVMNGVDPSPQEVTLEETLLRQRHVDAFLFNQQVTDSVTETLLGIARQSGVPVVGVYETMPAGYDYQGWMVAQTLAIQKALADHTSTVAL